MSTAIKPRKSSASSAIRIRANGLRRWLKENAPACAKEQRHLDEGTAERAYWHYGYLCALRDALTSVSSEN